MKTTIYTVQDIYIPQSWNTIHKENCLLPLTHNQII